IETVQELDRQLEAHASNWYVREVRLFIKRVLKRLDLTARSIFALIEPGSCFAGTFLELALAADRSYMLASDDLRIALTSANFGTYPTSGGISRLQVRSMDQPERYAELKDRSDTLDAEAAEENGLVTVALDDIDWEDEVRLAIEERAS